MLLCEPTDTNTCDDYRYISDCKRSRALVSSIGPGEPSTVNIHPEAPFDTLTSRNGRESCDMHGLGVTRLNWICISTLINHGHFHTCINPKNNPI
jgi:hypothetical protein